VSIDEVRKLSRSLFESGGSAQADFQELLQLLFSATVLKSGERLKVAGKNDLYTIQARPTQNVLMLTDGRYCVETARFLPLRCQLRPLL
jgi:hypothetical protein